LEFYVFCQHKYGYIRDEYTTVNFTDEFRRVSVTLLVSDASMSVTEMGVAGWARFAWSAHSEYRTADVNLKP